MGAPCGGGKKPVSPFQNGGLNGSDTHGAVNAHAWADYNTSKLLPAPPPPTDPTLNLVGSAAAKKSAVGGFPSRSDWTGGKENQNNCHLMIGSWHVMGCLSYADVITRRQALGRRRQFRTAAVDHQRLPERLKVLVLHFPTVVGWFLFVSFSDFHPKSLSQSRFGPSRGFKTVCRRRALSSRLRFLSK